MKQTIRRMLACLLLLTALCTGPALTDRFGDAYTDPPPPTVLAHIAESCPGYLLEDYITINGTEKGNYAFALISQGAGRVLLGYRDEGSWLRNADAVPQGEGYAFFRRHVEGGASARATPRPSGRTPWVLT